MNSKVVLVARLLLGLMFFVFGLNGLLTFTLGKGFIPMPPPPAEMAVIMAGFMATKYMMTLVMLLEFLAGVFLLSGFFINLALVFLAPLLVNILGIHLMVERSGLPMAILVLVLFLIIFISRWSSFKPLFAKK